MDLDSLTELKKQYLAAMSREMKSPLKTIAEIAADAEKTIPERAAQLQDAARYLMTLVDELTEFSSSNRPVKP